MTLAAMPAIARGQTSAQDEIVELWPGPPPGDTGAPIVRKVDDQSKDPAHPDRFVTGIAQPILVVRRPARPNGAAMLVLPGGGYGFLSYDNEGVSQADWLNARGITAFILLYRLPGEGWTQREDVPLQDAQRAMRLIRIVAGAGPYLRFDEIADAVAKMALPFAQFEIHRAPSPSSSGRDGSRIAIDAQGRRHLQAKNIRTFQI